MDFDAKTVGWTRADRARRRRYAADSIVGERGWRKPIIYVIAYLLGPYA